MYYNTQDCDCERHRSRSGAVNAEHLKGRDYWLALALAPAPGLCLTSGTLTLLHVLRVWDACLSHRAVRETMDILYLQQLHL